MPRSRFTRQIMARPSGNATSGDVVTALAGLDMVTPTELITKGRTPEAKNFRLYAQTTAGREVPVSTRKGPSHYVEPLTEALKASYTTLSGTSVAIDLDTMYARQFTAGFTGVVTKIDLHLAKGLGAGTMRVDLYSDSGNLPAQKLAETSVVQSSAAAGWVTARFLNAVEVAPTTKLWIVVYMQDDATAGYVLSTTTGDGVAYKSTAGIIGLAPTTFTLPYRIYGTAKQSVLGGYRFNRENGVNRTLVPIGTSMYYIDEATGTYKLVMSGLSAAAKEYSFTNGDGKVFWVNAYDPMYCWTGVHESEAANLIGNPSFTTDTSSWVAGSGTTLTRDTAVFNSTPASLKLTAASGNRAGRYTVALTANKRYKITLDARGVGSATVYANGPNVNVGTPVALTGSFQTITYYYTPTVDVTSLDFFSAGDWNLDNVSVNDTGVETIVDADLGILKEITFHKDRLFGVTAADNNKLVFSENPGNPSDKPINQQWYRQWLSVSFIYVPRPMNGSPITGIISFQDSLTILTQDSKYILSGSDRGSFYLRESTGNKGALSRRGIISDPNYIYFVSHDGLYRFNGSKDELLSDLIKPIFDACPDKSKISLALWKNQLRCYMRSALSAVNDICSIRDLTFNEWMLDTKTYIDRAVYYSDADDNEELIEFNSKSAGAYYAETDFNALGGPIDFDYRLKYNSMGVPGQRKKIKRFFPLVQAVSNSFTITHGIDKDLADAPQERREVLPNNGEKIGTFTIGDGTILGGATVFKPKRISVSGYANLFQYRITRNAVNNQVAFMGVQLTFKAKRL